MSDEVEKISATLSQEVRKKIITDVSNLLSRTNELWRKGEENLFLSDALSFGKYEFDTIEFNTIWNLSYLMLYLTQSLDVGPDVTTPEIYITFVENTYNALRIAYTTKKQLLTGKSMSIQDTTKKKTKKNYKFKENKEQR